MRSTEKILAMIAAVLGLAISAKADTQEIDGITWTYIVENGEASVGIGGDSIMTSTSAVPGTTTGAIDIPSTLGGYPVTGISAFAFSHLEITCVTIPESVTNIGVSAFAACENLESVIIANCRATIPSDAFKGCTSLRSATLPVSAFNTYSGIPYEVRSALTNLVFASGTTKIDTMIDMSNSAYSTAACPALQSVTIPASVTRIGDYVFKDCASLTDVYFEGDAPDMGVGVFLGTPRALTSHVTEGTIGWSDDFSSEVPETWNGRRIAVGGSAGGGTGGGAGGGGTIAPAASEVYLTVTNVVVHYILNSVVPEVAVPVSEDTGFVTVVTEIKGGAVSIPESWKADDAEFVEKFGSDFAAALTKPTGKKDAQGNPLMVWQDFVAGTDPTDENDVFTASITMVDGEVKISYTPELSEAEAAKRKYVTYGKASLQDEEWQVVDGDADNYNFFKVTVEMR